MNAFDGSKKMAQQIANRTNTPQRVVVGPTGRLRIEDCMNWEIVGRVLEGEYKIEAVILPIQQKEVV